MKYKDKDRMKIRQTKLIILIMSTNFSNLNHYLADISEHLYVVI